jgi:D-alanyl-D-alanine carboxypeptidase
LYFKRGGKTLVTLAVREGYFIACIVLGKDERAKFEEQRKSFGEEICKEYDTTEIYHDGKWMGFDIYDDSLVDDIFRLLQIKRKPNRKTLPEDMGKCGCLDIGLSHDDITNCLIP